MTSRTAAAKLAVCKWIRGQVTTREDEAKPELSDMIAGDRQAASLGGHKVGTVTMCEGKREFRVIDDNRLAEWVGGRNRSSMSCCRLPCLPSVPETQAERPKL